MADNTIINSGSGGDTIATDDIGGVKFQRVKLIHGADGINDGDTSDLNPFPVVSTPDQTTMDSFGRLYATDASLSVDVNFARSTYTGLVTASTASSGSNTQGSGYMQQATSTTNGGTAKLVSIASTLYRPGGELFAYMTAAWLQAGAAGTAGSCYMRVGLYDTNNGFYIGYETTTFGVTVRTGGVDTQTAKASFNVDTLTGAATSLFTSSGSPVAIDLTKLNVFRIRFGWLGAAPVKFEVLSPDGKWVLFHIIRQPNASATPSIQSPDLPMTSEVKNTGTTTNLQMNMGCWGAGGTMQNLVAGDTPHDSADYGNPVKIGAKAETTPSTMTLVADGDRTDLLADSDGVLLSKPYTSYGDILVERLSDTGGTSTASTVFGATASTRNFITTIAVYNDSTTGGYIDFRDGTAGTILFTLPLPAKGGAVTNFTLPLRQTTANTAFAYDVSAALTTVYISLIGFKSKA